jgi:hypothetical protein
VKRVIDLTLKIADGTASEAECRELERLIDSDRRARRMHLEMMEIEAQLRASPADSGGDEDLSLAEERTVNAVMAGVRLVPPPRPLPRFAARPIWAVLALAGVAASAALVLWPRMAGTGRTAAPSSFAFGRSRAARESAPLPPSPRATGWSSAPMRIQPAGTPEVSRLELDDGLALEIRGRTVVRAIEVSASGARRLVIDEGTVSVEGPADRVPAPLLLVTPQGEVVARVRKAMLSVAPDATKVDIHEGTALVKRSDGRSVELTSRQSALLNGTEALAAAPLPVLLFLRGHSVGRHPTDLIDAVLVRHLEGLGFAVEVVDETDLNAGHAEGKALIMISPSTSGVLRNRIEELSLDRLEVPIICSRPHLYPDLSMAPADQAGHYASNATRLNVIEPNHPLSGGFAGPLQVTRAPGSLGWGQPGPGAVRVATFPDSRKNDCAGIFAYERGAPMTGPLTRAPARRVGFFLHPDLAPYLTDSGWALLDAAVRWATDESP